MNEATYGASIATARSRLGGVSTVKPWLRSSEATAFQLEPSAHAPWTRTIVGFGMSVSRWEWSSSVCGPRLLSDAYPLVISVTEPIDPVAAAADDAAGQ